MKKTLVLTKKVKPTLVLTKKKPTPPVTGVYAKGASKKRA